MHFQMRILAKLIDFDEHAAISCGGAQLGPAIAASTPSRSDTRGDVLHGHTCTQRLPEVDA
jgi:hypothetical protein